MAASHSHSRSRPPPPNYNFLLFLLFVELTSFALCINTANLNYSLQPQDEENEGDTDRERDRIIQLPGQPTDNDHGDVSVSQFSGYITVNESHGRALFYWFFQAQSEPLNKPLLLWLNGGPGCSSIGYGAAVELGPLRVAKKGAALECNEYSWNKEANLLFVESPIGVGFSYTNTSSDFTQMDDKFVAEDAYNFVVKWLERFPQFKNRDFFISGESYAGHYVPQLAELVYDRNKNNGNNSPFINLKGFIVGNPETNDYLDYKGILEYAWSHSVISDEDYNLAKRVCNFKLEKWSTTCNNAMTNVFNRYKDIDIYNIYAPSCLLNKTKTKTSRGIASENDYSNSEASRHGFRRMKQEEIPAGGGGYDPCYSTYTARYFNRMDVQKSLHIINSGKLKWKVCNDSLFRTYKYTVFSVLPVYRKLLKGGLKIWIYSGDADGRVPVIGSRYCIEALELGVKSAWTSWFHNDQVAGRTVVYEGGLRFVTVRGAGHLVPLNKPAEALALISSYLSSAHHGDADEPPLPTHPN